MWARICRGTHLVAANEIPAAPLWVSTAQLFVIGRQGKEQLATEGVELAAFAQTDGGPASGGARQGDGRASLRRAEITSGHCIIITRGATPRRGNARPISEYSHPRAVLRGEKPVRPPDPMLAEETVVTRAAADRALPESAGAPYSESGMSSAMKPSSP